MSDNAKISLVRPKVRFFQSSGNEQNKEEIMKHTDKTLPRTKNNPRIKSLVTLKKPMRLVNSTKSTGDTYDNNILPNKTKISMHNSNAISESIQIATLCNDNMPKAKASKILCNTNNIQITKDSFKKSQFVDKNIHTENDTLKDYGKGSQQKGKENKDTALNRTKTATEMKTESSQYVQSIAHGKSRPITKNNVQKINTASYKGSKIIKSLSVPNVINKIGNQATKVDVLNTKSAVFNVMPCYKYTNTVARNKVSSVKKTALQNTLGLKIKTSVKPGISHKQQDDMKTSDANKKYIFPSDIIGEKLAQPKYNSSMCTSNKLKELKQQKIVTDIDHLPSAQKNLVHEKISTALDFPLDEAIFKNLVDLSVNDEQLPSTITRSKDPERRQKNIIPKLSNFFMPEHTREICVAVHINPRSPKIDENLNILKINNKILDWRHTLDNA